MISRMLRVISLARKSCLSSKLICPGPRFRSVPSPCHIFWTAKPTFTMFSPKCSAKCYGLLAWQERRGPPPQWSVLAPGFRSFSLPYLYHMANHQQWLWYMTKNMHRTVRNIISRKRWRPTWPTYSFWLSKSCKVRDLQWLDRWHCGLVFTLELVCIPCQY